MHFHPILRFLVGESLSINIRLFRNLQKIFKHNCCQSHCFLMFVSSLLLSFQTQQGESWWLCNCTKAVCIEDNIVQVIPVICNPPPKPTCANGLSPVPVIDEDGCCWHWECDCKYTFCWIFNLLREQYYCQDQQYLSGNKYCARLWLSLLVLV